MNVARLCALACACVLLNACGGGGGGGGGASNQFRITLDRTSLAFDVYEGTPGGAQTVFATATGEFEGTIYIGALIEGQGVSNQIPVSIDGNRGTIQISPNTALPPGQYTPRVLALVCSDPACNNRIGGTPIAINCNVTIRRGVSASTRRVYLSSVEGTTATSRTITVTPAENMTAFNVVPLAATPWVQVTDVTATSFRIVAGPQPPGRQQGAVDVNSGPTTTRISVDYTSAYAPGNFNGIFASPDALTFNLPSGMQESKTISVVSPTSNNVRTEINYDTPSTGAWLTVTGANPTFTVTASTAGLANGQYTAAIHVDTGSPFQPTDMVTVTLNVGPTLTSTAIPDIVVNSGTSVAGLGFSSTVGQLGGVTGSWAATSSTPWLSLTQSSGAIGTDVEFTIPQGQLAALANLTTYEGSIHLTSSAGATAIDVPVVLHKRIGQVTSVGPTIQFSGRPLRTVIRGRGFSGVGNLVDRFHVTGATIDSITAVNDSAVIIATPALAAGDYPVGITNELGLPTTTATIRVLNPTFPVYDVVPSSARVQSLFVDPQRASVYAVRPDLAELVRYRLHLDKWQTEPVAVPLLLSAGMSNDGSSLLVASGPGRLTFRDPETLVEKSSFDSPESFLSQLGNFGSQGPLPVSNDNRVWFGTENPAHGRLLTYFDPATSSFHHQDRSPFPSSPFHGGPRIDISRDGLQLIINEPLMTLSSADEQLVPVPTVGSCSVVATADDGSRTLCDGRVYDGAWQLRREIRIADAHTFDRWVSVPSLPTTMISPSGEFAYVFAFHEDDYNFNGGPEPTPTHPPRVYVFDLTGDALFEELQSSTFFEFDGLDYPTCRVFQVDTCTPVVAAAISPDGNTLYYIGDRNLIVVPIPAEFR